MNKSIAVELKKMAVNVAERFSMKAREMNVNNETFSVDEIIPTSDHSATVVFKKNTGKKALSFFYYIPRGYSKGWKYFFPTDSHISGFRGFEFHKLECERFNYKYNFKDKKD